MDRLVNEEKNEAIAGASIVQPAPTVTATNADMGVDVERGYDRERFVRVVIKSA